jgi:hypothetical protein
MARRRTSEVTRSLRRSGAVVAMPVLLTTLLLAAIANAQDPAGSAQGAVFFRTADGTPFLLVPMKTRTVHWINLHPARLEDEPVANPDLALAVARSSLLGEARPGEATAKPKNASPLAWEEALRRAPSAGSQLVRIGDHVGVRVTFPARSLGRVAQLLRLRTRRTKLHRITAHYLEIQSAREARLARVPDLELLRRALDTADPKRKLGSLFVRGGEEIIDTDEVMSFYKWNCQPARAINVLVGGFDAKFGKSVLEEVFREPMGIPKQPESHAVDIEDIRSSVISKGDTLMIVHPLPAEYAPELDLLVDLLAGDLLAGDNAAFLPEFLHTNGHASVRVQARARFPRGSNMLLLQVTQPDLELGQKSLLPKHVKAALDQLSEKLPADSQVRRAISARRARRARRLANQEGLARSLALRWVRGSIPDPKMLAQPGPPDLAKTLQTLAKKVLSPDTRTLITKHNEAPK